MSRQCRRPTRHAAIEARRRLKITSTRRGAKSLSQLNNRKSPASSKRKSSKAVKTPPRESTQCEDTPPKSGRKKFWAEEESIGELSRHSRPGRKILWEKIPGCSVKLDFSGKKVDLREYTGRDLERGERQIYLVNEVLFDIRNCLGAPLFEEGFPECKLKEILRSESSVDPLSSSPTAVTSCSPRSPPIVLASCLYRYDSVSRDAMILLFTTAKSVLYPAPRGRVGYTLDCRGRGLGRVLDYNLCEWLMKYKECRSAYVEMLNQQVAHFWTKIGYVPLVSRHDSNQTFRGFHGTVLARKMLWY